MDLDRKIGRQTDRQTDATASFQRKVARSLSLSRAQGMYGEDGMDYGDNLFRSVPPPPKLHCCSEMQLAVKWSISHCCGNLFRSVRPAPCTEKCTNFAWSISHGYGGIAAGQLTPATASSAPPPFAPPSPH